MASNLQIRTRWIDERRAGLITELVERETRPLRPGEILVAMRQVPLHGSFWLASHPAAIHPRRAELLANGELVFGSGGVGCVVDTAGSTAARAGDHVAIFGHVPCARAGCIACTVHHRYVECGFGESTIIGHGGGALDGTYARHVILPPYSYEVCPDDVDLSAFMYAFLFADVRNALTRHPDTLARDRMILVGAGLSGLIAAHLFLGSGSNKRLLVVDPVVERTLAVESLRPGAVARFVLRESEPEALIESLGDAAEAHFAGARADLVFDASSGDGASLWANRRILSPGCHSVPFGFGNSRICLDRELLQLSGLCILLSRGVGDLDNRRAVMSTLANESAPFVATFLTSRARELRSLHEALAFIRAQHERPGPLLDVEHAIMTPNPHA